MARIPETELERLKRETDLVVLVTAAGIELRRHGANLVGRCPFHEDQGPSLVVTPAKNLWHCLGACQAGGSVIDWVMRAERVSFRHAAELLMKRAPSELQSPRRALTTTQPLAPIVDEDDHALARAVIDHYHATLKESAEAIAYLESRGLNSVAVIDHFQLGFANRTLGYRLPKKILKAGSEIRGRLQRLGFLRASGHEHLTGSITVPVFGERGQMVQCYGRKITPNLRDGTPLHLYLPGPHTAVWNVDALVSSKEIILCEALLDAMTFWNAGFRHVIASYGVSGFVDAHRAALRRYGTERVLIAYDSDEAGERAAVKVADELQHMGIAPYRVHFPRGLDVNTYANAHAPASESLGALLQAATWIWKPAPTVTPAATSIDSSLVAARPSDEPPPRPTSDAHPALAFERRGDEIIGTAGDRTYRVRGLAKNHTTDVLRVNPRACRQTQMHVDTLDLRAARARAIFIAQAATELGVNEETVKREVGALLLALESMVAEQRNTAPILAVSTTPAMSDAERDAAFALLRDPNLLDRITHDVGAAGIVGEETNALVAYLAAVSRKLPEPLAVIIQSASAAGKTSLMDAVLSFVPSEDRVQYSAMTGQALFYMAETDLRHKVLAVVEEEGAERAAYALKLLQSEGELSIASTGKDPSTGKLVTHAYRVEGPVMIMLTTTAVELDEEFVNRALVLTVDETPAQTRAIHVRQRARRTLAGRLQSAAKRDLLTLHRNAQRLLEPVAVVNPYAPSLTFQDTRTRTRRDHEKYLTLIDVVAFLHQHQRNRTAVMQEVQQAPRPIEYIEVTPTDIAIADRLARAVLTRSLDELPPQTRRFLSQLSAWLATEHGTTRFLAREARVATGLGATQVKLHLRRLIDLEYVIVHRTRDAQGIAYELVYDGAEESSLDILCQPTAQIAERSDETRERSGVGRPPVGPRSGGGRSRSPSRIVLHNHELADVAPGNPPTHATTHGNGRSHDKSYVPQSLEEVRV